jgi:hypothetical protein
MNEETRVANLPYKLNNHIIEILDGFKWATHEKNTSAVIVVDGRSGLGKTTLAAQMGLYCDPDFSLKKVHYDPDTFMNGSEDKIGLSGCKEGDYIMFDEAMLISNRSAMSRINIMMVQAMSMIRSKKIIVVFCVNSLFDLDKNLALHRADILFHVYGDSLVDRGKVMAFFKGIDGRDRLKELYLRGKKYYDYGQPKSNFNCNFPKHFIFDEDEYEKQKQVGVNRFLQGLTGKGVGRREVRAIASRDNYILWLRLNTELTIPQVAEIGGVSTNVVDDVIARYKEELEQQENR